MDRNKIIHVIVENISEEYDNIDDSDRLITDIEAKCIYMADDRLIVTITIYELVDNMLWRDKGLVKSYEVTSNDINIINMHIEKSSVIRKRILSICKNRIKDEKGSRNKINSMLNKAGVMNGFTATDEIELDLVSICDRFWGRYIVIDDDLVMCKDVTTDDLILSDNKNNNYITLCTNLK